MPSTSLGGFVRPAASAACAISSGVVPTRLRNLAKASGASGVLLTACATLPAGVGGPDQAWHGRVQLVNINYHRDRFNNKRNVDYLFG
jgi:hypothetical protein